MKALIAIAALVGNPAKWTAIRHADGHRPAGLWHARREQRRGPQYAADGGEHTRLRIAGEIIRIKTQPTNANLQIHSFAFLAVHRIFTAWRQPRVPTALRHPALQTPVHPIFAPPAACACFQLATASTADTER